MASLSSASTSLHQASSGIRSRFVSHPTCMPSTSGPSGKISGSSLFAGKRLRFRDISKSINFFEAKRLYTVAFGGTEKSFVATASSNDSERTENEVDSLVGTISFGQLCDEFECISSPAVERTARQLARDILQLKENSRLLSCHAANVEYKDPLRSFTGREKFRRPSWLLSVLENPTAAVLKMEMKSSSELMIKWRVKGKIKIPPASLLGNELCLITVSTYTINQISGQVVKQIDEWDLSECSPPSLAFFWPSRAAWSVNELINDAKEGFKGVANKLNSSNDGGPIYSDPTDPRKFFQEANPNSELYQIGFFIALAYLLVQTIKLII